MIYTLLLHLFTDFIFLLNICCFILFFPRMSLCLLGVNLAPLCCNSINVNRFMDSAVALNKTNSDFVNWKTLWTPCILPLRQLTNFEHCVHKKSLIATNLLTITNYMLTKAISVTKFIDNNKLHANKSDIGYR